ncbi:hypothetical protein MRB53_007997 [Persea americana]|uniref:Uncharacterized protein n=1 Tax=Persea americana TaxID=3435 RepID=A0ACC2MKT2_PERAE|nr:hypothetical protein MRB53_007997 [Persea americana]
MTPPPVTGMVSPTPPSPASPTPKSSWSPLPKTTSGHTSRWSLAPSPPSAALTSTETASMALFPLLSPMPPPSIASSSTATTSPEISLWIYVASPISSLDLSGNSLSGPFPDSLSNSCKLQCLLLAQNLFSSQIMDEIWPELGGLVRLDLSSNGFEGSIPAKLKKLKSLSGTLNLSFN